MKIEIVKIESLKVYSLNAKRHPQSQIEGIAESIRRFGFTQAIVIDSKNEIIIGHGRLEAAKLAGLKEVPCLKLSDLSKEEVKALRLIDNRIAETEWDSEMLALEFNDLDFDFSKFNINFDEFQPEPDEVKGLTDEDAVPEVPEVPKTKLGNIFKLGNHRLMCGDSTSADDVAKLMGGGFADMLLTDPPYNVAYTGKTKDALKIENDEMSNDDFKKFLTDAFSAVDKNLKEGGCFYIWHADAEGYNFRGACKDIGWKVRQCLIWVKQTLVMGRQDYHWKHEPCLYGWKDGAAHFWNTDRKQTTVLEFDKPQRNDIHPTMKPVNLFEYQIGNNTKQNEIVLDVFGGSGTTMMACEKLGRQAMLMELDPKYCDVIIKRFEDFTGKKAELVNA